MNEPNTTPQPPPAKEWRPSDPEAFAEAVAIAARMLREGKDADYTRWFLWNLSYLHVKKAVATARRQLGTLAPPGAGADTVQ